MVSIRRLFGFPDGNPARVVSTAGDYAYIVEPLSTRTLTSTVTDETALAISAVYRAVQLIASTIASMPLHVYEQQDDGSSKRVTYDEDAYLWRRPNEEVPDVVFWETVIGHEVLYGNAFLWVERNGDGDPFQLWPIQPGRVQVGRDDDGRKFYKVDGSQVYRDFLAGGEIVHVPGFGYDGLRGISPIRKFALTLGLAKTAEEYAGHLFANGSIPAGILSTEEHLDTAQAAELSERWEAAHGGAANAHKVAVLGGGLKWHETSINPEDAQLIEMRQFQISEIARMFGVPEHMLGAHDKTSSWGSGIEVNNRFFLQTGLLPHMRRFEATIRDELLMGRRTVRWEIEGLLRGTSTERAAFYNTMRQIGVYSVNEIRALENLGGIGEEGDTRVQPLNMATVGGEPKVSSADADAVGSLIRSGFSPAAALDALGLPEIDHLGLLPVTLQKPVDDSGAAIPDEQIE